MTERQEDIRDALRRMFKLDCTYLETVLVRGDFKGIMPRDLTVEVFAVHGHPKAVLAYAWSLEEGDRIIYTGVLGVSSIRSPSVAVQAAVASGNA